MVVGSLTVLFIPTPLSFVATTIGGLPYPMALFLTLYPLTLVILTCFPFELAYPVPSSISEWTSICAYSIPLGPAQLLSLLEYSLEDIPFGQ